LFLLGFGVQNLAEARLNALRSLREWIRGKLLAGYTVTPT